LLSGGDDGTLAFWDVRDTFRKTPLTKIAAHDRGIRSLTVSPLDNSIISGGRDNMVRLWAADQLLSQRSNPMRWEGQGVILSDIAFANSGMICIAGLDGTVVVQDVMTRQTVYRLKGTTNIRHYLAVNRHAGLLAVGDGDTIRIHELTSGKFLWSWQLPQLCHDRCFDISPTGREMAVGSDDRLYFFDARTGQPLRDLEVFGVHDGRWTVRYAPTGHQLAFANPKTQLLDLHSSQVVAEFDTRFQIPRALEFSPTGDRLATAGEDGSIMIWAPASGMRIGSCLGHTDEVFSLDYSPDGKRLLSASKDGSVRIWDAVSFECLMTMTEHDGFAVCARFSPDGQIVASCGDDRTVVLRFANTEGSGKVGERSE
jgi:WD40 repeat protein